ncbi:MAG: glycoside hydrolase family 30 protein, partial [Turicibacter sp.]
DHNRDVLVERATTVLADPEANKYIWGVGNHWYLSEDFENLSVVHNMFPDKHLLFTEGCVELTHTAEGANGGAYIGSWDNGERYGRNIIGDFNNWSEGWIDWNLVLNEIGGPNHVHNYCEAPIMVDRQKGELVYNVSYFYIGHFSKFIKPGAKRVALNHNAGPQVHATAFKNENGEIVVVVQNEGWIAELSLVVDGLGANITLPDHSITTYILK